MTAMPVGQTLGDLAVQAIDKYLTKAQTYEDGVLKDRDPENLHQMRVNLRRLRTAMQVFAPGIELPKAGREPQVAKVARRLGQLRDLDVIAMTLEEQYLPDLPAAERQQLKPVFKRWRKQRRRSVKQVKKTLQGDRYQALKARLQDWIQAPHCTRTAAQPAEVLLPDLTLPLVSRLWLHPAWLVGTEVTEQLIHQPIANLDAAAIDAAITDHSTTLHSLRKQVKRVRYQLKLVSDAYGDRLDADLERFKQLQEVLGHMQDSLVLADFLESKIPRWETTLPTLKALLANHRHHAWQQWQLLQQHYLLPAQRAALRQILMQPGVEPVTWDDEAADESATASPEIAGS